jgi:uncharacterized membrane protein
VPPVRTDVADRHTEILHRPLLAWRDRPLTACAIVLAALAFSLATARYLTFRASSYDLAVFEQAMWKLSHLRDPFVQLIGWNIFADHLSPVLVVFAPLYRLAASPLWFFAAQAAAFGCGLLALGPLLDVVGVRDRPARGAFFICYSLSPLLWNAVLFDFHPSVSVVPLVLAGLTAALSRRWRALLVISICIVLLRDDLGLVVAAMALVGARTSEGADRRLRIALFVGGLSWVAVGGWIGTLLGSDRNLIGHYGYIADSFVGMITSPIRSILLAGERLFQPDNLGLLCIYAGSVAALVLARMSRFLLAIMVLLPQLLSRDSLFHSSAYHYGAPVFALLILGSAEASVLRLRARRVVPMVLVIAGLGSFVLYGPPRSPTVQSVDFRRAEAKRIVGSVLPNERVSASEHLTPHLAHREFLLQFPLPFAPEVQPFPLAPSVTRVGRDAAAQIDAVAVTWGTPDEGAGIERLLASYGFRAVLRLKTAALYRRSP